MTDVYSKYAQAIPCKDQSARTVAKVLRDVWFVHYGIPLRIHSDQGRDFDSLLIREVCALYGVKKSRTTPYHPEGNGQVERFNRRLCCMIRSMDPTERRNWPEMIAYLVFIYNTTPHRSTGYSPYRLMYGREPCIPVDQLPVLLRTKAEWEKDFVKSQAAALVKMNALAEQNLRKRASEDKQRYDRKVKLSRLEIRQRVLQKQVAFAERHMLADKFFRDPYIIVEINEEGDVCRIRPDHGGMKTVNRRLLILDPRSDERLCFFHDSK